MEEFLEKIDTKPGSQIEEPIEEQEQNEVHIQNFPTFVSQDTEKSLNEELTGVSEHDKQKVATVNEEVASESTPLSSLLQEDEQEEVKSQPVVQQKLTNQSKQQQPAKKEFYKVIEDDSYLKQFEGDINARQQKYRKLKDEFAKNAGSFLDFAHSYKKFGLNINEKGDLEYREWAETAKGLSLFGDFNEWNRESHKCTKDDFGIWTLVLPKGEDGEFPIKHDTKFKCCVTTQKGEKVDRVPAWTKFSRQNVSNNLYEAVFWNPPQKYEFKHDQPTRHETLRIYEAHVGMSSEHGKVSTYREFADNVLPRIKDCGYNCIQLMAIQEHSYYASFGYHVTNFFAISSRSGTPDDIKYLVDTAHSYGIMVIMDLIHSHASLNVLDGIAQFDGTDHQYCHSGAKGRHSQWDSMLFDYSKYEVLRFLLSNIAFFLEEYKFDGYRFDAVTSILYQHHGIGIGFSGDYKEYFGTHVDMDGIVYLMLANDLMKEINPNSITVAEDVSGMPTLCRDIKEGGIGFDFRLSMYIPDMWVKIIKELKDEEWNMGHIAHSLTNRRWREKCVAYAESHDQAIVGDKTLSMQLFDKEIYTSMSTFQQPTMVVDRGMSLHKMIRLITIGLGGEAYLNFMGNEFGHPEWIDFPREGNGFSYHYCRRQWNLADNPDLQYNRLKNFDKAMNTLEQTFHWLTSGHQFVTLTHEGDKLIVFERGDLLFIFNFHHSNSYEHYRIGTQWASEHVILLDSDAKEFGGHNRLESVSKKFFFPIMKQPWQKRNNYIQLYIPNRTCMILCAEENLGKYGVQINGRPAKQDVAEIVKGVEELKVE